MTATIRFITYYGYSTNNPIQFNIIEKIMLKLHGHSFHKIRC